MKRRIGSWMALLLAAVMLVTSTPLMAEVDGGKAVPAYYVTSFFKIGSPVMEVYTDGVYTQVDMGAVPYIKNNRTMLPVRFVGEALGADITYIESRHAVRVEKPFLSFVIYLDPGLVALCVTIVVVDH